MKLVKTTADKIKIGDVIMTDEGLARVFEMEIYPTYEKRIITFEYIGCAMQGLDAWQEYYDNDVVKKYIASESPGLESPSVESDAEKTLLDIKLELQEAAKRTLYGLDTESSIIAHHRGKCDRETLYAKYLLERFFK